MSHDADGDPADAESTEDDDYHRRISELLTEAVVADSVESIDRPHIVICHDLRTDATSYIGPFADGIAAMAEALREHAALDEDGGGSLRYAVAPLMMPGQSPPEDLPTSS